MFSQGIFQSKMFLNRLRFDRIMVMSMWPRFFGPPCTSHPKSLASAFSNKSSISALVNRNFRCLCRKKLLIAAFADRWYGRPRLREHMNTFFANNAERQTETEIYNKGGECRAREGLPTMSCFADWSKRRHVTLSIIICSPLHGYPVWHPSVTL